MLLMLDIISIQGGDEVLTQENVLIQSDRHRKFDERL